MKSLCCIISIIICILLTSCGEDKSIGKNGGPRCCKRDSYIAICEAVKFTAGNLGVDMELDKISCNDGFRPISFYIEVI